MDNKKIQTIIRENINLAFPDVSNDFIDYLMAVYEDNGFTVAEVMASVKHVINNNTLNHPTIAHFLHYKKDPLRITNPCLN